ncbi:MAG: P4 alpha zinc-binding domain-containing protein [Syntrophaceae bacterium]|nr:MAG: P4 alpha zinc-binding domain-containing protein [Syntrophaceae bacterium]
MNVLELITGDGFTFKRVAATHGGEYAGPCPFCGGNDRFLIWPEDKGGRYWCRGCEKTGDAIQYMRDTRGISFADACRALGISKAGYRRKRSRPISENPGFRPKKYDAPPALWMQKAETILKASQSNLWTPGGQAALDVLLSKGLTEETIRRAGIGFNPTELYRDRRGWGLPQEIRSDGKPKLLWIPAGLVIPQQDHEGPARLRIRRHDPGEGPRYVIIAGSNLAPLILESEKNVFVIVESELDAFLCWQEAGDLTSAMAMGAAGMKPDISAHELLLKSEKILNGLDYDEAGARYAWKFWPETYGQKLIRWPVPIGKDPSDAWQRGLNIRAWIEAGLSE